MPRRIPLRSFLSLHYGLVITVQLVIVAILAWLILLPQMRDDISVRHQALARAIAGQVEAHLLGGERQLRILADYIQLRANRPATEWTALLDAHCADGDLFETIYIADSRNQSISSAGLARERRAKREDLIGMDISGRGFPALARQKKTTVWSETFLSTASSRMAVAVAIPLVGHTLIGEITVDRLSTIVSNLPAATGSFMMILDRRGRIVADSQRVMGGQQLDPKTLPTPVSNDISASRHFEMDGRSLIGTVVSVDQLGWKILVAQPQSVAFQPIRSTFGVIGLGLITALLFAIGLATFQAGKLTNLFGVYADQAQSIARGFYDLKWPPSKTIEFAHLGDSLRQMADTIRARERQLIDNENNLRITLNAIGDAVIATDANAFVTAMNPVAEQLTGWTAPQAIGRPLSEVFHIVNSQTRHIVANPAKKVLAEGKIVGLANHTVLIARDGREYQIADSGAPIRQADGAIAGVVLVFRDVTAAYLNEQKIRDSERLLKNITDNVPGIFYRLEASPGHAYTMTFISEKVSQILGLEVTAENFFTQFCKHIPDDQKGHFLESIRSAVDEIRPWRYEGPFIKPDGEVMWISVNSLPHKEKDNVYYGVLMDITERKHAEEEARRLQAALTQSQKMEAIGTLAGGIAHDFNNILSAVIGYAELTLRQVKDDDRLSRNMEQILAAGMRAKDLVSQILTFSRQDKHNLKPLQVGPLIKEALKLLRSSLPTTIEISQQIAADVDNVLADAIQIHQIVMNLCTNAAQAMEENGGLLTVGLQQVVLTSRDSHLPSELSPGRYLKLSIQDTGPGIPPQIREKIFEPYFTTKQKGKGTGLGLSVVHGIVQRYGGAIHVSSQPGGGTLFNVFIPSIEKFQSMETLTKPALPKGNESILLVDDESVITDVGQLSLQMLGYKVVTSNNSLAALEIFKKAPWAFDLVISDMTMPKMTGDKLAVQLLQTRKDLPIILCTGFSDRISENTVAAIGVKALAMKPLSVSDLAFLVRKTLDAAKRVD